MWTNALDQRALSYRSPDDIQYQREIFSVLMQHVSFNVAHGHDKLSFYFLQECCSESARCDTGDEFFLQNTGAGFKCGLIKMAFFNHWSTNVSFFLRKATEILMLLHYNSVWIVSVSKDISCWYLIDKSCRNNKRNVCNVNDIMTKIPGQINTFGIIKNLALSTHSKTTCLHHVLVSRSYSVHWLRSTPRLGARSRSTSLFSSSWYFKSLYTDIFLLHLTFLSWKMNNYWDIWILNLILNLTCSC